LPPTGLGRGQKCQYYVGYRGQRRGQPPLAGKGPLYMVRLIRIVFLAQPNMVGLRVADNRWCELDAKIKNAGFERDPKGTERYASRGASLASLRPI
jgi:hypothetical protein